jgi:hypothetical protein
LLTQESGPLVFSERRNKICLFSHPATHTIATAREWVYDEGIQPFIE